MALSCIENEAGKMIKGNEAGEVVKGKSCYVSTLTQNMLFYAMTLETNRETPNILYVHLYSFMQCEGLIK